MRIALLCPDVSSNALVRTYPIAKVLERRHKLQVLGFRFGTDVFAPYRDEFTYQTLEARRLPAFLSQARDLARHVHADAVYVFKPIASSLWVGLWARKIHRIPLILDIEDWETGWYYDTPWQHRLRHLLHVERPNGFFWTWLTEKAVHTADEVFVVSRFLQSRFGGTLLVHGADTSAFDPSRWRGAEARARLGLPDGRYVVFAGTPHPRKGLEDLLDAAALVGDAKLRVLVVGSFHRDDDYRRRLLDRHAERLVMIGPRPHREMPLYLAAADVVALPQRPSRASRAQVPGKLFEAMAMARPVLATAVSDLPEILDGCGVVVPTGAIDALAAGLAGLLERPDEAHDLGERARRRCQTYYSWDAMEGVLAGRLAKWERS